MYACGFIWGKHRRWENKQNSEWVFGGERGKGARLKGKDVFKDKIKTGLSIFRRTGRVAKTLFFFCGIQREKYFRWDLHKVGGPLEQLVAFQ